MTKIALMTDLERILDLLAQKPGRKAQQIAEELGLARPVVMGLLHGEAGKSMRQDSSYRWWLASRGTAAAHPPASARKSFLSRLCGYYLECLARESVTGVSLHAGDTNGYVPLAELPFQREDGSVPAADRRARRIVQKVRKERGQLSLYVGYAVRVRTWVARNDDDVRLEPILLYPIEDSDDAEELLRPATGIPLFNLDVLKALLAVDSGNILDEAIHLSEELGLANPDEDLPHWDEIILRLQRCRPDWNWAEDLQPYALGSDPPVGDLRKPGIYNRAILFAGTRSPFTYGLEVELHKLAQLEEEAIHGTALGAWMKAEFNHTAAEGTSLMEVVPLNTEQRQAVLQGLTAPLTVVTGPPGTGKSQVVTSLLTNMAWQGRGVLFSSKNNHAVDVVEARVNNLGAYPVLLRLGKGEHHARIAQTLTSGLSESSRPGDNERFAWLKRAHTQSQLRFAEIEQAIEGTVAMRNAVDEWERGAETARLHFGPERFRAMRSLDVEPMQQRLAGFAALLEGVSELGQPAVVRRLLESIQGNRFERIAEAAGMLVADAAALGLEMPGDVPAPATLPRWTAFHRQMQDRCDAAARVTAYWQGYARLRQSEPIENLICELTRITEESSANARELYQCWLRLWPSRWNPAERKLLSEYLSLLQIIAGGERFEDGAGKRVFRRYYSLFPKVAQTLPCWAVTSLSARGRLPFEPALFDLVVIDEASQCDIASALPLLFRARRAVVIGDPLQLRHVSTVGPQQDRLGLAAHGLAEGHAVWAYSVNSLFDVARSLCRHEDLVNLRDHHRSHRDIISFSNRHFYRGGLRIATKHDELVRPRDSEIGNEPAVRWVDVVGKVVRPPGGGAINPVEADAVVQSIHALVVEQEFDGAIGVVTPFRAQANRIRTLVMQHKELASRLGPAQFVVDTVHGFQGDERDVIFFSPVVSMGVGTHTLRFLNTHGNLFNVAVTRARSELVVVGDRRAALESGVGYLASFAEYSEGLTGAPLPAGEDADPGPEYPPVGRPDLVSDWERVFYRALYSAGLRPVPQYEEAPFTLDFALFAAHRKLDIEVDGENYHRNWDGELCRRDQIRSRRLGDLGWDVMRFWVYEIREDLEASVMRVKEWAGRNE
ncbi:MAG: ATP-binding protein [Acidobacteria bacterium]|nr:ATP-binding protein [Acidobacteriota bacterium]